MPNNAILELGDGVKIAYRSVGNGAPVLFHPGFSLTQSIWNPVVDALSGKYRCITFDPRGHGASDAPPSGYSVERMARDVVEIAEKLGLKDVTLVGHSFGGAVSALAVADSARADLFSRLVLIGAAVPSFVARPGMPQGVPTDVFDAILERMGTDFEGNAKDTARIFFHKLAAGEADRVFSETLSMRPDVAAQIFAEIGRLDLSALVGDIRIPVLALWGAHDNLSSPAWSDWFKGRVGKNWSFGILNDSGHGAMLDEPEELSRIVDEFI